MRSSSETQVQIDPAVRQAVARLARATDAQAIVLFGSRARGDWRPDSDWDICVMLPDDVEHGKFTPISLWPLAAAGKESVQVYPIRRSVFEEKRHDVNAVSHDIDRDGVIVYGSL